MPEKSPASMPLMTKPLLPLRSERLNDELGMSFSCFSYF
jgi:hypothetical protein